MRHAFITLLYSVALTACMATPESLRGTYSKLSVEQARGQNLVDQRVRWGGVIIDTRPSKNATCFEVNGRFLDPTARPIPSRSSSGRFIACAPGFYDPIEYAAGRQLTVVGMLNMPAPDNISQNKAHTPRVAVESLHLWPHLSAQYYYYNNDPFCGYWDGHWHGRCDYWPPEL